MRKFPRLFRRRKEAVKPELPDVHIGSFALLNPAGEIVEKVAFLGGVITLRDGMTLRGEYTYEYPGGLFLPPPAEVDPAGHEWTTFMHTSPTYLSDTAGWVEAKFESPLPRGRTVRTALQVREERAEL